MSFYTAEILLFLYQNKFLKWPNIHEYIAAQIAISEL